MKSSYAGNYKNIGRKSVGIGFVDIVAAAVIF